MENDITQKYWYSFVFQHTDNASRRMTTVNSYGGYPAKKVSLSIIEKQAILCDLPSDTPLVNCCFLGKMTDKEFKKGSR